jgi:hypothetical protein
LPLSEKGTISVNQHTEGTGIEYIKKLALNFNIYDVDTIDTGIAA